MSLSVPACIMLISLSAIPITYVVNTASTLHGESGLLVSGVAALTFICVLTYFAVIARSEANDPMLYVLTVGTFSSVVDIIVGLEGDGLLTGFMTRYLQDGEPYLKTPYGIMVSYWDGTCHYITYLMMLYAISRNCTYREIGLYWAGSIGHSMIVFIPGNIVGKYGIRPSFLLNVPYIIVPFICCAKFLKERPSLVSSWRNSAPGLPSRPFDFFLIGGLVISMLIAFLRGFGVLGCQNINFTSYIKEYEPYLLDPVSYPMIQMIVYLFYYVPFYIMAIYALLYPGCSWMPDWSIIHAGAAAQAQIAHVGGALHHKTTAAYRIPTDPHTRAVFWIINMGLFIMPHILAYRCAEYQNFFHSSGNTKSKPDHSYKESRLK